MKKDFSERKKRLPAFRWSMVQIIGALCLFVGIAVLAFMQGYSVYTDRILYEERLGQMREVTEQLFDSLEEVIGNQWYDAELQSRFLLNKQPTTEEELTGFLQKQAALSGFEERKTDLIVVDNRGRYYTQSGAQGLLNGMEYLMDSPERISFISSATTRERTQMMFLLRLEKPLTIQDGKHTVQLVYCGIARDMTELNQFFSCRAYQGENAVYVLDKQGTKLFNGENSSSFIDSFNVYSALRKMKYLHGSSFERALAELNENQIAYSNAVVDNRECYYSLYQMDNAAWVLLFMVPSDRVAVNTVSLVDNTTRLVLGFAVCLIVISGICIYWLIHRQQKDALQAAEENNRVLEDKNEKLREAQKATREALQTAEMASRAKTDFLSSMSHDIRTPMNAIVGLTGLMEGNLCNPDKLREYLGKLKSSSTHLLNLINEILDMNKIESGKATLNDVPFTLTEQVDQLENVIRPQSRAKGLELRIEQRKIRHEWLIGDATRLQQVLLNILSNSVKYTDRGGHILLDVEEIPRDGHYARYRFSVTDDGIGMSEEFQKHIYESFTREESTVTNTVQGTGLGMAITKSIVDMMGGSISLSSELGKGSCFEVVLEFRIDEEAQQHAQQRVRLQDAGTQETDEVLKDMHFLCAEDNELNAEILKGMLEMKGASCTICRNGAEIVEKFQSVREGEYDAILMDVQMPVMNGYEATRRIRSGKNPLGQTIPIIAMTANAFSEDVQKSYEAGMDSHLSKPVDFKALEETLRKFRVTPPRRRE